MFDTISREPHSPEYTDVREAGNVTDPAAVVIVAAQGAQAAGLINLVLLGRMPAAG
ncbi:hypothetical protein ACOBQX_23100 [Actinokineospora sp. G85]|uniref:hypothetical protein n=1 Tax=Actinokineospora sp. G85 TaxID=3406626 RepID=UPI003C7550F1